MGGARRSLMLLMGQVRRCRWWLCRRTVRRRVHREHDARKESVGSAHRWIQDELLHAVKLTEQHVTLPGDFQIFFGRRGDLRSERGVLLSQASRLRCRIVISLEFFNPFLKRRFLVFQTLY